MYVQKYIEYINRIYIEQISLKRGINFVCSCSQLETSKLDSMLERSRVCVGVTITIPACVLRLCGRAKMFSTFAADPVCICSYYSKFLYMQLQLCRYRSTAVSTTQFFSRERDTYYRIDGILRLGVPHAHRTVIATAF